MKAFRQRVEYYVASAFDKKGHACFTVRQRIETQHPHFSARWIPHTYWVTDQTFRTKEEAEAFISDLYCGHLPEENYA
jgi:hypothetical protein